ncbi:hypothetical protein B0T22DRAFT_10030 [Podospora appendiculata]|uniref:Uncharacterized protein n=1 Tax=Podospora appendiculata TaxID=314037 RepID=A0AAE1CFD3_9PEZI|nr:hypothetical protein B0T22DRAFT_10030 [Podospora appendiculata]
MKWARNPFFKAPSATASQSCTAGDEATATATEDDVEAAADASPSNDSDDSRPITASAEDAGLVKLQRPTERMTGHQKFYILGLDGVGAAILSGGINFAIAYAMYTTQDTVAKPIRLWQLPNTLAGDAGVTILLQSIITWLIELLLVNRDLASGGVAPIGFIPPPQHRWLRWFMFLDRTAEAATPGSVLHWVYFLASQVLRALIVAVATFCLVWGPSVGILTAVGTRSGGDWVFEKTWAPEVFKLVLGAVLGILQTPLFTVFWLARAGWALRTHEVLVTPVR